MNKLKQDRGLILRIVQSLRDLRIQREIKQSLRNNERILYLNGKIKEEKESIKDCLEQNFLSMAKTKIERIERLNEEIQSLR